MLKRTLDITISASALLLLFPLIALISAAVALDSGLPVLYAQVRVGRGFRCFRIWKFRSMSNAVGPPITCAGDSRVTRAGKLLRATKLDELPQLWNVFMGEMSLVGPRPEVPAYVEMFRARYDGILSVRPGITDLASIRFRNEERLLARAEDPVEHYKRHILPTKLSLAEEYVRTRSLKLDLLILIRTCQAVLDW